AGRMFGAGYAFAVARLDPVATELGSAVERLVGVGAARRGVDAPDIVRGHHESDLPVVLLGEVLFFGERRGGEQRTSQDQRRNDAQWSAHGDPSLSVPPC